MGKKLMFHVALTIIVVAGLTSCSRDYHFEYAGKYHPDIHTNQPVLSNNQVFKKQDNLNRLPELKQEELVTMSASEQIRLVTRKTSGARLSINYPLTQQQAKKADRSFERAEKEAFQHPERRISQEATANSIPSMKKNKTLHPASEEKLLYCLLGVLLPPLAVALWEDGITINFWLDILFTLLFWIPGVIFAWIIILST